MKIFLSKWFITSILFLIFNSCVQITEKIEKDNEIEAITKSIDSCIGWFKNKDFDLLFSVISNDSDYTSIHPSNRIIRGFSQFKKNSEIFKNPKFKYVRHEISDLSIHLSKSGDVAWFSCKLNDMNEWNSQPANWENTRWTGVLEKRDHGWVIVQQHFSFASDK